MGKTIGEHRWVKIFGGRPVGGNPVVVVGGRRGRPAWAGKAKLLILMKMREEITIKQHAHVTQLC